MSEIIWQIQEDARIYLAYTETFEAEYMTAATDIDTPMVANTHYKAHLTAAPTYDATAWLTVTVTSEFAQGCIISVENTSYFDITLTYLIIKGTLIEPGYKVTKSGSDATSIQDHGERTLDLRTKYPLSIEDAVYMINYALNFYKDPQPLVRMTIQGKTDALLAQVLNRNISERVSVVNTRLGMNTEFYIEKVEHEIDEGDLHTVTYTLGKAVGARGVWVLNTSKLDTETVLAY